jgi:membrane-associated protease RseP (regulator of RpoE activity)
VRFDFEGNVIEVAGDFEGVPGRFIIDTGSRADVVLTKSFAERNGLRSRYPNGVDTVAGWGIGGPSHAYATRRTGLGIGPVHVPDVVTFLSTDAKGAFAGSDFDGDIGGGILKRFVVTFDYKHQLMYLKPANAPQADVGTFDRAGMWFNRSPTGFAIVDVAANTPAARAGLAAGDEIVSVDGAPAKT